MYEFIMSHVFGSHRTIPSLEALGGKRVHLVDNSFCGELKAWASIRPHVNYLRPKVAQAVLCKEEGEASAMAWQPLCCSASWNLALRMVTTEWAVNVNPDTLLGLGAHRILELTVQGPLPGVVLYRTQLNFNIWVGHVPSLRALGGFDPRFKPCAAEDEDLMVRLAQAGHKWSAIQVPAMHQEGGHRDRVDGYRNTEVFRQKWGWAPHSPEYNEIVGKARV